MGHFKPCVTGMGRLLLAASLATLSASCKSAPEEKARESTADQTLGRSGAPIRFFDLNLYLTIGDSLPETETYDEKIAPLRAGGRIHFTLPDSGIVRASFYDGMGSRLRVYPDSLFPVPGSHPITISQSDTLSDSLTSGVYICRIVAGDSTLERQFEIPDPSLK